MDSYISFADFYDGLTQNVEYSKRCDYILKIFKKLKHKTGVTLDLACGTGSLTFELAKKGVNVFGADASEDMLCQAQSKACEEELDVMFLCQKMQNLELLGTIDTCVCTLDSINHLTSKKAVQQTFNGVSRFMNKSGYFLFDVNTVYKHQTVLADNSFVYDTPEVFCVWQNTLLRNNIVQIDLDFFEKNEDNLYVRSSESFCERAYTHKEIVEMLEKAGFRLAEFYGDMTFDKPKADEQRVIYVAQKK